MTSTSDTAYDHSTEPPEPWPDIEVLEQRLSAAVTENPQLPVRVVSRSANSFSSTFPTEIVTCCIGSDPPVRLFCKHFRTGLGQSFGKGDRPFHEIDVYRYVLASAPVPVADFIGAWISPEADSGLLVLAYLNESRRLGHARDSNKAAEDAATWIGEFHRYAEQVAAQPPPFLQRNGAEFYRSHCAHLVAQRDALGRGPAWLGRLSDRFGIALEMLEDVAPTVIHGEYYPKNVLLHAGRIVPVDWETAQIGMGEMDLATLVDGWPKVKDRCLSAYARARGLAPGDEAFLQRFALGQILVNVYWLSHSDHTSSDPKKMAKVQNRLEQLRDSAEIVGVL